MKNFHNQTVTSSSDQVQSSLVPASGVLASTVDMFIGGTAINANNMVFISTDGSYRLIATDMPASPTDPVAASATSDVFKSNDRPGQAELHRDS